MRIFLACLVFHGYLIGISWPL